MATKKTYEGARRPAPKFNFMPKQTDHSAAESAAIESAADAAAASDDEAPPAFGILSDDEEPEDLVESNIFTERDLRRSATMASSAAEPGAAGGLSRLHAEAAEQTILSTAFETPTTYNPLQKRQIKINLGTVPAATAAPAAPTSSASGQASGGFGRPLLPNPADLALGQGYVLSAPPATAAAAASRPRTPPTPPAAPPSASASSATGRPRTPPTPPLPPSSSAAGKFLFDFSKPPPGFEQSQSSLISMPNLMRPPPPLSAAAAAPGQPPSLPPPPAVSTLAQPPRGPLLGDRPVSEQTRRSLPLPSQLSSLPRPPTPPPPATPGSMLNEQQQPPQPPPPPPPASMPTGGQRRVLLDEPPPPSLETAAADRDQQTDEDAEVKQAELFLEQLASWLANIKSYESDMNEYFQSCAQQMHEHYASSQQTEDSKKIHETEYRKLYDEYEKFAAYMRQMSQHYEDTKADLEKRRAKAVERRDKRLAEQRALKEKQLAAHAEPPPTRSLTNNAEQLLSDSLLVEAYSTTSTAALTTTNSTTASMTTASALGAAAAAAVSALSRMDLSDPDSWNKFAATLPANSDTASYYKLYSNQMVANFQRMLVGVPAAEAERLSVSFAATLQSEAPGGGAGGGADSGGESDSGIAGGLTLQGLSRNQRKKLRKRAKALQDAKAAKRQHRKLLLAAPASGPTEKGGATDSTGGTGDNADEDADAKPTPPPGYMDPAGDPRLVMQDYFERFANGEWNYATWNQYITVMQRHNPAWYEVFIAQSKQHGINWDDMYRYYTGGKAADHLADLTGGRLTSASGAGDGPPSILELAAQPAPPPPPERLFDDDNNEKVDLGIGDEADLVELDALDNNNEQEAQQHKAKDRTADSEDDGDNDDDDEDEDDDDDDWSFCKLCNQEFRSERGYLAHLRGVTHMKNALDRAASKKPHMFREERARQEVAVKAEASAQAKHQMWVDAQVGAIKRSGLGGIFECLLCNVKCNSQKSLDFHVNGDKHKKLIEERVKELEAAQREKDAAEAAEQAKKAEAEAAQKAEAEAKLKAEQAAAAAKQQQQKQKSSGGRGAKPTLRAQTLLNSCLEPLLGLQYVTEYQRINPMLECRCYCELCNLNFPVAELINHATGIRHRRLFFRAHYPDLFAILSQDRSPRSVKIRRYSVYAQRVEDWEGRKKMNLKVEVETTDESGSQGQLQSKSAAAASPAAPVVKYTLKSSKRPRNAAAKQNRGRGGVDLEEGEIDGDAVELSDGGAGDEESDPEEGEALDNAGPPEQPGVVFEDAILIDREPLTNIDKNSGSKVDNGDIAATREAFIKRLKEQKVLSTSEATKEVLDSIGREADWAIKRKKRAAGIVEDDADLIKFGATVANSAGSDATSSSSSGQPQQQQQQQQQHMTSLVEQIRSMTGINLGISRAQADAFRIPSIPGLRLDIDRIKDTPDPVAQMRNLVSQIQEFVGSQKAVGYAAGPSNATSSSSTARLGLLSSSAGAAAVASATQQQPEHKEKRHRHLHKDKKEKKEKKEKKRDRKERERKEKEQQQQQQKLMGAIHLPGKDTIIQVTKQHKKAKKQSKHEDKDREKRNKDKERAKAKEKEKKDKIKEKERKKLKRREQEKDTRDRERTSESKRRRRDDQPVVLPTPDSVLGLAMTDQLSGGASTVFDAYSSLPSSSAAAVTTGTAAAAAAVSAASTVASAPDGSRARKGSSSSSSNDSSDDDDYVEKSADWLASLARNSLYGGKKSVESAQPTPSQPVLLGLMGGSLPPPPQQPQQQQQQPTSFSLRPPLAGSTLGLIPQQQQQQQQQQQFSYLPPPQSMMQQQQQQQQPYLPPMQSQGPPLLPINNNNLANYQQYQQHQQQPQQPMFHHHSLPLPSQFLPQQQQQQQQQQQVLLPPPPQPQPHQQMW
ncbi:hypothetical protein BOX15_Mlig023140g3 [Macrostomum lignano]|uniref:C2H2-type domain-containing protein n=1 Tax=Macrostomum lignano TaxID=282301 RepID=A0A267G0F1_9PLAT|nr:hypothetical protein BOX15_Mlig023140g3 [Macrostomum lignano]